MFTGRIHVLCKKIEKACDIHYFGEKGQEWSADYFKRKKYSSV